MLHDVQPLTELTELRGAVYVGVKKVLSEKRLPEFFGSDVSADIVANLVFGLFESDGYVTREQTGSLRIGYTTTSEQLAHQVRWLFLRWGIGSSVRRYQPTSRRPSIVKGHKIESKLPIWEVRVSGIENVRRFADVIPMWGPRGTALMSALADPALSVHRGSQRNYLPAPQIESVLAVPAGPRGHGTPGGCDGRRRSWRSAGRSEAGARPQPSTA